MAAQGRGGGKTPGRLVQLLDEAVKNSSQSAVARETGLTQSAVGRYIKGIGEPSQGTLEKLAYYFGVTVGWLRGGAKGPADRLLDTLIENGVTAAIYNDKMSKEFGEQSDYWGTLVCGNNDNLLDSLDLICELWGISSSWILNGIFADVELPKEEIEDLIMMPGIQELIKKLKKEFSSKQEIIDFLNNARVNITPDPNSPRGVMLTFSDVTPTKKTEPDSE